MKSKSKTYYNPGIQVKAWYTYYYELLSEGGDSLSPQRAADAEAAAEFILKKQESARLLALKNKDKDKRKNEMTAVVEFQKRETISETKIKHRQQIADLTKHHRALLKDITDAVDLRETQRQSKEKELNEYLIAVMQPGARSQVVGLIGALISITVAQLKTQKQERARDQSVAPISIRKEKTRQAEELSRLYKTQENQSANIQQHYVNSLSQELSYIDNEGGLGSPVDKKTKTSTITIMPSGNL